MYANSDQPDLVDEREFAWTVLLPGDATYETQGLPYRVSSYLNSMSKGGQPTIVREASSMPSAGELTDVESAVILGRSSTAAPRLASAGLVEFRRFAVLPSFRDARWFVPLDERRLSLSALRQYTPYRRRAVVAGSLARIAARLSLLRWHPHQVTIGLRNPPEFERIASEATEEEEVRLALMTGTPGPTRKVTATVLGLDGETKGFAKIATSELTRGLLQSEASALIELESLQNEGEPRLAPRLLHSESLGDAQVTVQSSVSGKGASPQWDSMHEEFINRISYGAPRPINRSTALEALTKRVARSAEPAYVDALRWALSQLSIDAQPIIIHGDLTPWNIRVSPTGAISAFDWEQSVSDGFPLFDRIVHDLTIGMLLEKWSLKDTIIYINERRYTPHIGLSISEVTALMICTVIMMNLRRIEQGGSSGDTITSRLHEILHYLIEIMRS